jgi:chaperone modulatory protein CbpM
MNKQQTVLSILLEDTTPISFTQVCHKYHISHELLIEMLEHGLFTPQQTPLNANQLKPRDIQRMESAFRLHRDLGINLPGVAVALELLDQMDDLRQELDILRKHVKNL